MKFLAKFAFVSALALSPGLVLAQVTLPTVASVNPTDLIPDVVNGQPGAAWNFETALQNRSFVLGQNSQHLAAPTLTTTTSVCGGTGATVKGTDLSGQVAEASSASTSCVITFATAFATAPECFVSINNVSDSSLKCSTTTTAMTVTQTSASSNVLNYLVVGLPGG
jgi:hypothetical protein